MHVINRRGLEALEIERAGALAAARIVLETQSDVEIGAVHVTVFREDVTHSGGNFAANGDAAVPVFHLTAANDEVFGWHGHTSSVVVATGFNRNAIIAGGEDAFFDQNIATRFGIAPVSIWSARV